MAPYVRGACAVHKPECRYSETIEGAAEWMDG
jgi:hypothetical protein